MSVSEEEPTNGVGTVEFLVEVGHEPGSELVRRAICQAGLLAFLSTEISGGVVRYRLSVDVPGGASVCQPRKPSVDLVADRLWSAAYAHALTAQGDRPHEAKEYANQVLADTEQRKAHREKMASAVEASAVQAWAPARDEMATNGP